MSRPYAFFAALPVRRGLPVLHLLLALAVPLCAESFPHRAKVVALESLTHDVNRITFQTLAPDRFRFRPGQYVLLKVPEHYVKAWNVRYETSYKEVSRPYSLASSPSRLPVFELIIKHQKAPPGKRVPPGLASTYVHTKLRVGDVLRFSEPIGALYSPGDADRPIILVAGGAGVSPFVGLLEYWFEGGVNRRRKIYLYLGVRGKRDLLLDEVFSDWAGEKENFTYVPALSDPDPGDDWKGETGYINRILDKHFPEPVDAHVYIAGSPIMVRETVKVLQAKGLSSDRIHHDPIPVR